MTPSAPAPIAQTDWALVGFTVTAFFVVVSGFALMLAGAGKAARR